MYIFCLQALCIHYLYGAFTIDLMYILIFIFIIDLNYLYVVGVVYGRSWLKGATLDKTASYLS